MKSDEESLQQLFAENILRCFDGTAGRHVRRESGTQMASVWMFVDHVLLTYQEPVYVTIGRRRGDRFKPLYSNLSSQDRDFLGLRLLEDEEFGDQADAECIALDGNTRIAVRYLPRRWPNNVRRKPAGWHAELSSRVVRDLYHREPFNRLIVGALTYIEEQTAARTVDCEQLCARTPEAEALYVRMLGDRLGPLLDSRGTSHLTQSPDGRNLNLFVVYRRPGTRIVKPPKGFYDRERIAVRYPFSAGVLLTARQKESLGETMADDVSWPLENNERSIADTLLIGGNIDFSLPDETSSENEWTRSYHPVADLSGRGARRKIAEDELYIKAFSGGRMPNPRSIFYVPIHINAQPWFGMFRWFDPNADDFEKRISNVHFYRDVVSTIAEAVGGATEEAYADAVARVVANTFASTAGRERFLQVANDTLTALGDSYPYSIVQLGSAGSTFQPDQRNVERLEFPGQDQDLFLTWGEGKASVEYRPLDPKFVKESVERALQRAVLREAAAYKKALEVFGHSIGGVMQASGFGEVAGATRSLKRKFGNDPEVLRLFQSVQFLDRHIKVVQGFGETLRLRKTNGQGFPRQWFGPIVPRAEIDAIAAVAERIALFYLWPRWRMEPKWRTIAIESDGVERVFSIDDEYVSNRAKNLSDLYPFSGPGEGPSSRHSGTIVASLGLAELIFNATNKLIDSIRNNLFSEKVLQHPLMRLRLEKISHTGDDDEYIRITVLNCSAQRPNLEAPKAVQEIQQLERSYMYCRGLPVLETTIPKINEQMSGKPEGCFWVQADWSYHFKRVISEGNTEGAESKP